MVNLKKAYSVSEAAEVLGVSEWLIREAIRRGEIYCTRIGSRIIIPVASLDQFLTTPDERQADDGSRPDGNATD